MIIYLNFQTVTKTIIQNENNVMIMIGLKNVRITEKKKNKNVSYMFSMMKLGKKLRKKMIVYLEKVTG